MREWLSDGRDRIMIMGFSLHMINIYNRVADGGCGGCWIHDWCLTLASGTRIYTHPKDGPDAPALCTYVNFKEYYGIR